MRVAREQAVASADPVRGVASELLAHKGQGERKDGNRDLA